MRKPHIRQVAVLGAGVMGAQIAAHLVNAKVKTLLFELSATGENPYQSVQQAIQQLTRLEPSPLATPQQASQIIPATYDHDLAQLTDCDLVIEAIAERLDWKQALYTKILPYLSAETVLASNTSGLALAQLSALLPVELQSRFCGIHFFNPPRYLSLVELIATPASDVELLDDLEHFLVGSLGKNVLRAKDTPNFIANRIGVFSLVITLHHAQRLNLGFDTVDELTGTRLGRAKTATFRTLDKVGLDTASHVIRGAAQNLTQDAWRDFYQVPTWLQALVENGALGQKTQAGVYRKEKSQFLVFDPALGNYRAAKPEIDAEVARILALPNLSERFTALRACAHPQAQFLWAIQRDVMHYAAVHLAEIADTARDVDLALSWGFAWQQGIFELWQAIGWEQVTQILQQEIAEGKTAAAVPLPEWVFQVKAVHTSQGSWSPRQQTFLARSTLPIYHTLAGQANLLGESPPEIGETVFDNGALRAWHRGDGVLIASFLTKLHTVSEAVLDGLQRAVEIAEQDFMGLVIWHDAPFSVGADLSKVVPTMQAGEIAAIEQLVRKFQVTTQRLQNSYVPTVAAVQGLALGGGCEILMHCHAVVAAFESYIGLVETGVGLIPAGGGCKLLAQRAASRAPQGELLAALRPVLETLAMSKVSSSAEQARQYGFLQPSDRIVMHPNALLNAACARVHSLVASGFRPELPGKIAVAGRGVLATFRAHLLNLQVGGFISAHDHKVASYLAAALCGGEVESGMSVDAAWLLHLEREGFMHLLQTPETLARIQHTLSTGKPLRN